MNFSKIIRVITAILFFVGFFLIMGSAGNTDYADAVHEPISESEYIPQILIGVLLMLPTPLLFRGKEHGRKKVW